MIKLQLLGAKEMKRDPHAHVDKKEEADFSPSARVDEDKDKV